MDYPKLTIESSAFITQRSSLSAVRVSVVVATYQRPDLLNRCLAVLLDQKWDSSSYEIIVVDDAPDAETKQVVESWMLRRPSPRLRYIPVAFHRGPAAARNLGWRAAHGEIIAFTDDDCVPMPDWLAAGVSAMTDNITGAWGRIIVPIPRVPTDYERDTAKLERAEFATANCFYRRGELAEVGGFDERFTMAWREDSDLYFTLLERGERLVQAPDAVVFHPARRAPWGISLAHQHKNLFNALLYKKHPALYRRHIQPGPPWHYYGIVGTLLVAVEGFFVGQGIIVLTGLIGWIGLTARFCLRRLYGTSHELRHIAEMLITSALIPPLAIYWRLRGAFRYRVWFL